ncbi:MAG: 3-dehydroquinate synthase [Flavobacteriales bacterium]|nr:3-dehydroquinate synthase [Flavobacteriales bacterium]
MAFVYFENKELLAEFFRKSGSHYVFISDENCRIKCLSDLAISDLSCFSFESGEKSKNMDTYSDAIEFLISEKVERHSILYNIGGGVVTDLGGFVAATYMRGIGFVNIPTSLLAMVDASFGGKVGIDFKEYKNYIGIFAQPKEVLVCPEFLESLATEELYSGYAEVLKHGLIRDSDYWNVCRDLIPASILNDNWLKIIKRSVEIKTSIVEADPFDKGIRKTLNFGHTVGHAIESLLLNKKVRTYHGFCVAAGMVCESYISKVLRSLSEEEFSQIHQTLSNLYQKLTIDISEIEQVLYYVMYDKKNSSEGVRMSLLNGIGNCEADILVSKDLIAESIQYYIDTKWFL